MKKVLMILTLALAALVYGAPARAAHTLSGVGDIIVDVQNELGQTLSGATVVLTLPGADGSLDVGFDTLVTHIDGQTVGGNADGDGSGADGDAEFSSTNPSANFGSNIANGQQFRITVTYTGYVTYTQDYSWSAVALNTKTSANKFTVKVVVKDELGNSVNGAQAAITGGLTAVDGGSNDSDSSANGTIYVAQNTTGPGAPASVAFTLNGYLNYSDNTQTINSNTQTVYTTSFQYPFRIYAEDELNAPITMVASKATMGGTLTQAGLKDSGGILYYAATGGPGTVSLTYSGFVTSTAAGPFTYNSSGSAATITFMAAGDGSALQYTVHVLGLTDELGNVVAIGGATFGGSGFSITSQTISGGVGYVAASPAAGTLSAAVSGYITATATVTPSAGAMQTVDFDSAAQYAATVDGPGLAYAFKVDTLSDELANPLVPGAGDTFNLFTDSNCTATATYVAGPSFSGGAWYAAVATGTYYGKYLQSGYVDRCSVSSYSHDASIQKAPAFNTTNSQGLMFVLKIAVYDELGTAITTIATTDITIGGSNATRASSNTLYYALAAGGVAAGGKAGYANIDTAADTQLATVNIYSATQTAVTLNGGTACATGASITAGTSTTCKGLRFGIKVLVYDELGNSLTGLATSEVTIGGNNAVGTSGNALYYNTGSGVMASSKSGYVNVNTAVDTQLASVVTGTTGQTVVTLNGTTTCSTGGSVAANASVTCRGLYFSVKITVQDELATNVTGLAVTDMTIGGVSAAYATSTNALYYSLVSAGALAGGKSGFININTATDTQLASVAPGVTAQTVINMTSTVACATGGTIAAGSTTTCSGLYYTVKLTSAQEELGNAIVLAGGDGYGLYTDAACSATATYVAGPTFSGASWYAAVANGTYYAKYTQSGYLPTCSTATVTAAAAGPVANPTFTSASGNGLKYSIKILVYDELGTAITGIATTDITVGGSNANQASSGVLYYKSAAGGVAAGGETGYANIDTAADTQLASITPGWTSQTVVTLTGSTACASGATVSSGSSTTCKGLRFGIKVLLYDELGNALTGAASSEVMIGGNNANAISSNALYYNTGTGALTSSKSGYVNMNVAVDTQIATVNTGTTGQTVVTLNGTTACGTGGSVAANASVTCRGLYYAVRVNVSDELGTALTSMAVSDITINSGNAAYASSSALFYALAAAGAMSGGKSGFINVNTATDTQLASVSPGVTAQTVVNLTGTAACATGGTVAAGATVTCNGLDYTVKLTSAQEELGNAIVLAGGDSFGLYTDSGCSATATYVAGPTFSGAAWYAAVANGTYYAKYTQSGYLPTCSTATVAAAQAGPTVNPTFTSASGNGLKYSIKILAYNELGTAVTGMAVTDITVGGSNATQASSNALYYKSAAGGVAAGGKTGYANIDVTADTQLASITPGWTSQTVVTLTGTSACASGATIASGSSTTCKGLRFGIKVIVADELGNALTPGAATEITIGGSNAAATDSTAFYYNTGSGVMASSKSGYVNVNTAVDTQLASVVTGTTGQTVVTLSGSTACATGGSIAANASVTCRGLLFSVKVSVSDELATALTSMAVSDITHGGGNASYASSSALYYAATAAGAIAGGKSGFINISTATDTQLASVSPGVTAQTTINLTGTTPCNTGGTVAANATVSCDGLMYTVKLTAAQEELGNALAIAGADTFNLYTDSACSATATYVSGPTFSGAAWYAAVANGTYYAKYSKSGYVPRCDATSVTAAQAGPVANPSYLSAGGDGLLYALKIIVKDELATTVTGMLAADITAGGGAATQVSSNSLYYALTSAGAIAGGHSGYVNIDTAVDTQLASVAPGVSTQTVITLTGTTACNTGATISEGASVSCYGLRYGIKVNVYDELGNSVTPALTEVKIGGNNAATSVGNALYYNTGTGAMTSSKSGYVNVNSTVDTQLTTVNTGSTGQTVINLTGTTACATGASITQGTTVSCNGLKFAVKLTVANELGTALTPAVTDITINGASASYVSGGSLYYALTAAGVMAGGYTGYVNVNIATDTQLTTVNPGVTAQTVISLTGTTACSTGVSVAAGATVTCNGLDYAAKVIVYDELGNSLTMSATDMAINGVNAAVASTNALYFSISSAGALTGGKTGYINVSTASDSQIASVAPGTTGQTVVTLTGTTTCASGATIAAGSATTCSGLKFNVKFLYVQDEAAGAIVPIGTDEAKLFTDSACTTEATYLTSPTFVGGAWYVSVTPGTSYYGRYGRAGYVNTCDATALNVAAAGPQFIPSFVATDNDGLKFAIKVATVQDELGNTITMDGTETAGLYTDSLCTVAAGATIAGPTWYSTGKTWHIAMAAGGTYYTKLAKGGYVNQCDATAISTASSTQALPAYTMAAGDGLKYGLKVVTNDTFGNPIPAVTVTHGGTSPVYSNQGASQNTYYFNTAVVGQLIASKTGYNNVDSGAANVTPGGGAVSQTYITLTGDTNGPLGAVGGGSTVTRDGLLPATNVQIAVADSNGSGITGLSNLGNFYFLSSTGSRVIPSYFVEINSVSSPGVYQIKVATSSVSLQVKDVDDDTDPWVDYDDSSTISLAGISTSLVDYGTATMYPKADYVELISDGTLEATGTEVLTAVVRDNNGATITVGPNSTMTITFTISGGSASPASQKDITATTLSGAASVAGTSDTTITGAVSNGTATITIVDTVVGDGTTIKASLAPSSGSLSQDYSTNTTNFPITVTSSPASKMAVVIPSYTLSADNEFPVSFEVQDSQGNLVTSAGHTFTATISGSGKCKTTISGVVTTCSSTVTGSVSGGRATVNVRDTKAESITITVISTLPTLTYGSATPTIVAGTPKLLSLSASPSTVTAGTASSLTASVMDASGNVVSTSTAVISLSASGNAKFATASVGTMLSGAGSSAAGVQAASGLATLPINDTTAQTVTVTATDPNSTLTSTSTTIVFSPGTGNKLVFTTAAQTQTAGTAAATPYYVQVQDSNGNPLAAVPSLITVTMTSTSTGTVTYLTTTGSAVTTLQIGTSTDSAAFYYKDTKAGMPTITAAATGLTSATLQLTVNPGAPVTGKTVSTASAVDATQPTGKKTVVTENGLTITEYTYTSSTSTTEQVTADGSTRAKILVYVLDEYGNARSGDTVLISNSTSMSGVTITPTTTTTNSSGLASFDVTSTAAGTFKFAATVNGTVSYGNASYDIIFKTADRTPPDISTSASAYTLVNGDVISAIDPIIITTSLTDPGTNPSGVDTSSIAVTVKNSAGTTMPGTTNTSGCTMATSCEVRWTPTAALPAGNYTITFTVEDYNDNVQTKEWSVHVSSSNTFESVAAGAPGDGVFNPLAGGKMSISFQSPGAGTVVLEIYRRDGRMIYTTTSAVTGGYNELQWDGRTTSGTYAANGVYVFRLRANLTTGSIEQTGKLALFKQ